MSENLFFKKVTHCVTNWVGQIIHFVSKTAHTACGIKLELLYTFPKSSTRCVANWIGHTTDFSKRWCSVAPIYTNDSI